MSSAAAAGLVSSGVAIVQSSLASSFTGPQLRPSSQKSRSLAQTVTEANLAEAALVTSKACSPPRTRGVTRTLAPAVSIAARKSKRRGGRPNGDSGDGGRGGGGSDGNDGWWWDPQDDEGPHKRMTEGLWLWQALCWLSLIQAMVCVITAAGRNQQCRSGLLASVSAAVSLRRNNDACGRQPTSAHA